MLISIQSYDECSNSAFLLENINTNTIINIEKVENEQSNNKFGIAVTIPGIIYRNDRNTLEKEIIGPPVVIDDEEGDVLVYALYYWWKEETKRDTIYNEIVEIMGGIKVL